MGTLGRRAPSLALLTGLTVAVAAGTIWLAGFLYWHFRITAAVQAALESMVGSSRLAEPEGYTVARS